MSTPPPIPGFRPVPFTGVIFVMAEAARHGYKYGHPDWCNLGQGQPETGPLPGAPPRIHHVEIGVDDQDYTAYEELLDIFKLFTSIPILLEGKRGYHFGLDDLEREITGRGLSALLLSNPCNPTGRVIQGDELAGWVGLAREVGCTLLIDEFYSHYVWSD